MRLCVGFEKIKRSQFLAGQEDRSIDPNSCWANRQKIQKFKNSNEF
jgi:hypothetical protein